MQPEPRRKPIEPTAHHWRMSALSELYGPDAADHIEQRVVAALQARLEAREDRGSGPLWDQRDAWLIAYPDHFTNGDESTLTTLRQVLTVDFAAAFNGVHILPFHPASSDRGFSVEDYAKVAPRFGDWTDIAAIAAERRVMADAVINHLSTQGTWFRSFLAGKSPYDRYFRTASPDADLDPVVRPRTSPLLTPFDTAAGQRWVWTTFSADQADLDYQEPEVLIEVMDALARYVEAGASAIRLDAIAFLWKREGTSCIHLDETHRVIQAMRSWFDEIAPEVLLVTETNVPHAENMSYLNVGGRKEAQAVYQFALPPLVVHTARTGRVSELVEWFDSLESLGRDRTVLNFLASHDGVGVRPVESILDDGDIAELAELCIRAGGAVNYRSVPGVGDRPYELCSTWYSLMTAIDDDAENGLQRHIATYALCLAAAGIPLIYANAFLAATNDINTFSFTGHARDVNRGGFELADLRSMLADPESRASRSVEALSAMSGWRREIDAFSPDADQRIRALETGAIQIERTGATHEAVVVVNFGDQPVTAALEGAWTSRNGDVDSAMVPALGVRWWDRARTDA